MLERCSSGEGGLNSITSGRVARQRQRLEALLVVRRWTQVEVQGAEIGECKQPDQLSDNTRNECRKYSGGLLLLRCSCCRCFSLLFQFDGSDGYCSLHLIFRMLDYVLLISQLSWGMLFCKLLGM